jgi:DNA-binding CsgD family transcriptional regulator
MNCSSPKRVRLSPREAEILTWTAQGKTRGEISAMLNVSEETVKAHIRGACVKLNAKNKTHAAMLALMQGIISSAPLPVWGIHNEDSSALENGNEEKNCRRNTDDDADGL